MQLHIVSNDAVFILEIVNALKEHLIEGTILAALVVWVFLRSLRSTPDHLAGDPGLAARRHRGDLLLRFHAQPLTLLALLLLIGVVVDDAIVVLENIFRHREGARRRPDFRRHQRQQRSRLRRHRRDAVAGLDLRAGHLHERHHRPVLPLFAVVVTFGVLVSLFVSLTLTPMLCSRFLVVTERARPRPALPPHRSRLHAPGHDLPRHPRLVAATSLEGRRTHRADGRLRRPFFANVGRLSRPEQDEGRFLVYLRTPLGSSIDYTDSRLRMVEEVLRAHPESLPNSR